MKHFTGLIFLTLFSTAMTSTLAQEDNSLFENQNVNMVEPINLNKISKTFPQIMRYGYAGKILVQFDINQSGVPQNFLVIRATRETIFDRSAKKMVNKLRFPTGQPHQAVPYSITFCLQSDQITPVLCDIEFERISGPADPKVMIYSIPYYNSYAVGKSICGNVVVRFDVDHRGLVKREKFISSSRPGQFEISLKKSLSRFRFEPDNPQQDIEYKVSFNLPGRCKAP